MSRQTVSLDATGGRFLALAIAVTAIGLLVRLPRLATPPLDFHPARQYNTALIARALYRKHLSELPSWKRDVALTAAARPAIEPPLTEYLAATLYRLAGHEGLWLPRLASVVSWIFGAACLFVIALKLFSKSGAIIALIYCLFAPYGIRASQSLQPDPLMTALIIAGLAALLWYHQQPTFLRLLFSILPCALATLAKPVAIFFLGPVFIALSFNRGGWRGLRRDWHLPFWFGLVLLPAGLYYLAWLYPRGQFWQTTENRIFFSLLFTPGYWRGWLIMLGRVVGVGFLFAGLAGILLVRSRPASTVLRGLWFGYLMFGLVFNYHIHTHDYYSLPLVPIVSLSLAGLAQVVQNRLGKRKWQARISGLAAGIFFGAVFFSAWSRHLAPPDRALRETAAAYERLGRELGHSTRLIVLDGDYGYPIFYHGELAGRTWPLSFDLKMKRLTGKKEPPAASRFARLTGADYFVATNIIEFNAQPDLVEYLRSRFPRVPFSGIDPLSQQPMVVYDLRESTFEPDRQDLHFGALRDSSAITSAQPLRLLGRPRISWTARSSNPRFMVSPESGTGNAFLSVAIDPSKPSPQLEETYGLITIRRVDGGPGRDIRVSLSVSAAGKSKPPFGSLDLPVVTADSQTGAIFFAGWALDDIEVKRVRLYRNPLAAEPLGQPVLIVDIPLVEGARPDVERLYPNLPWKWRTGWGYRLMPESVPRASGPLTFHVYAEDAEGYQSCLGLRTITWRK